MLRGLRVNPIQNSLCHRVLFYLYGPYCLSVNDFWSPSMGLTKDLGSPSDGLMLGKRCRR